MKKLTESAAISAAERLCAAGKPSVVVYDEDEGHCVVSEAYAEEFVSPRDVVWSL